MKKIIVFLMIGLSVFSKDISIHLQEDVINKFLTGAGFFSDKTQVDLKITKFDLKWKVYDAKIDLTSKGSKFEAKIELVTDNKIRNGTVEGEAKFKFDKKTQNLVINVKDLKVRGLDIFNLAGFYEPRYELPIKLIRKDKIKIKRSETAVAYLVPDLYEESVTVFENNLLIEANINFTEE